MSPAHTATEVEPASNLRITFNENIAFGTGAITLRQTGGALVESFDMASPPAGLTLSGDTLTINPSSGLSTSTTYWTDCQKYLPEQGRLMGCAFEDAPIGSRQGSQPLAGRLARHERHPRISEGNHRTPEVCQRDVQGFRHRWHPRPGCGTFDRKTGGVAALNPGYMLSSRRDDLTSWPFLHRFGKDFWQTVYVEIDAMAIDDLSANPFAGISGNGTWSFTTTNAVSAATPSAGSIAVQGNGFSPDPIGAVGRIANGLYAIRALLAFSVANIVSNTIQQLNGFTLSSVISSGNTFADWIGGYTGLGGLTAFGDDAGGDGIRNGIEAFFGTAPNAPNAGLAAVAASGSSLAFTHPEANPPLAGFVIRLVEVDKRPPLAVPRVSHTLGSRKATSDRSGKIPGGTRRPGPDSSWRIPGWRRGR